MSKGSIARAQRVQYQRGRRYRRKRLVRWRRINTIMKELYPVGIMERFYTESPFAAWIGADFAC